MITEKIPGVTPNLPTLRDPDRLTYWKEDVGGLVWGGYEPNPKPWAVNGIPEGFHFDLLTTTMTTIPSSWKTRLPGCRRWRRRGSSSC